ncbi:hypothetical protein Agub_g14387, partial [Astrephomene gubernaculifera]
CATDLARVGLLQVPAEVVDHATAAWSACESVRLELYRRRDELNEAAAAAVDVLPDFVTSAELLNRQRDALQDWRQQQPPALVRELAAALPALVAEAEAAEAAEASRHGSSSPSAAE